MLDSVLAVFDLSPDYDLDVMVSAQDLTHVTGAVLDGMVPVLADFEPNRVLVQGDTTTTLGAALAAFYAKIPVGHVEAGLRSGNPTVPWPEEMNRRLTDRLSDRHHAPTKRARENLRQEGFDDAGILVTGNTGIDALLFVAERLKNEPRFGHRARSFRPELDSSRRMILVTAHGRESIGHGIAENLRRVRGPCIARRCRHRLSGPSQPERVGTGPPCLGRSPKCSPSGSVGIPTLR